MKFDTLVQHSPAHGHTVVSLFQDEVVAVAEKAVLQISDLLDWIADPKEISWDRGLLGRIGTIHQMWEL